MSSPSTSLHACLTKLIAYPAHAWSEKNGDTARGQLVPPGVGEQRVTGALRGEAGLGPGLAALHLEGAVLLRHQEGTRCLGGGDWDQRHQHCHPHL